MTDHQEPGAPPCACCHRLLDDDETLTGRTTCHRCQSAIAALLREVAALWRRLPAAAHTPHRPTGGGSGAHPTGSAAPGNLSAISLLAGDATARLQVHEDDWRRALHLPIATFRGDPGQTLTAVQYFLTSWLHWACSTHQADTRTLHQDLRRLTAEMTTAVTGERDPRVTVPYPCPAPAPGWDDDDPDAPPCGAVMRMDPRIPEIRCAGCRRTVPRHRWHELGLTVGSITLPTAPTADPAAHAA
ncbi:hypothetical protein ACIGZJ_30795 [Kitasatospora sp. NPDC052868]|uniref:hypothetical protein n=1 Tax=Kitasatospora sp. NPDC052868 TaxID=3364060 RepID=UPI0037CAE2B6